ncbi:arsenic transporter [Thioclava sp. BHET1]|nr:arsenic transporter [Thioclava sp. BHET1]
MPAGFTFLIACLTILAILLRPFRWPEYVFAVIGALILLLAGSLSPMAGLQAVARGGDVYAFLIGMMLLAECARREGLFDYLAAWALEHARGSARRLFAIAYGVGILTTVFLSNDATAVVLTPAIAAVTRQARVPALPYLFACAMVANAASFVLPISNPANLVVYGEGLPPLGAWIAQFLAPSAVAIAGSYAVLYLLFRRDLAHATPVGAVRPTLGRGGRIAALGLLGAALVLVLSSAAGIGLGLPTLAAGAIVAAFVTGRSAAAARALLWQISWGVLPLVAGLFVIVEAIFATAAPEQLLSLAQHWAASTPAAAAAVFGAAFALASNLFNNLPVGLIAASAHQAGGLPPHLTAAMLIGVDLGPNLSVTGSLATLLWLTALRRERVDVSAGQFLKIGLLTMPPALIAALAALIWLG